MLNESVPGEAIGGVIRGDAGLGCSAGRDGEIAEVKAVQRGGGGSGCSISSCGHLTAACMTELASQELQQQESHATGHRDGVVASGGSGCCCRPLKQPLTTCFPTV